MLLAEIDTGGYDIRRYGPPTEYPLRNPLSPSQTHEKVNIDLHTRLPTKNAVSTMLSENAINVESPDCDHGAGNFADISILTCGNNVDLNSGVLFPQYY